MTDVRSFARRESGGYEAAADGGRRAAHGVDARVLHPQAATLDPPPNSVLAHPERQQLTPCDFPVLLARKLDYRPIRGGFGALTAHMTVKAPNPLAFAPVLSARDAVGGFAGALP
jgi:hypothetical protein